MHFPLWIFFSIYCDICGITVFVLPAMYMQLQIWMKILRFYLCWPGVEAMTKFSVADQVARTPPWYFSFEKINLPNRLCYQNKGLWHVHTYCFSVVCPESTDAKQILCTSGWWKEYFLLYLYQRKRLYCAAQRLKLETQNVLQGEDTISSFRESERWKA